MTRVAHNVLFFNVIRGVAQLVAHLLWEQGAVSSSLATPTFMYDL